MNILPLVIALLIIFAMSSQALIKQRIGTHWESFAYTGRMQAEREARNKLEARAYKKAEGKSEKKEKAETSSLKDKTYRSRREALHLHEVSRLNIALLIDEPAHPQYHRLYNIAASLIRSIYGQTDFYKEGLEILILDHILEKADGEHPDFFTMLPDDPALTLPFYKMVKGTNRGYPPLSDYLTINPDKSKKPIHFCFASIPLLKAALGEEITSEILKVEREKWEKDHRQRTVTKTELNKMMSNNFKQSAQLSDLAELLSFTQRSGPRIAAVGSDDSSGILSRHHPKP